MLNTTLLCKSRSNMAAATMGSSKIFPHESGTGTRSFSWIYPAGWANTARSRIRAFRGVIGHC